MIPSRNVTRKIAEFVVRLSYKKVPVEVTEYVKTLIIDQLGVALGAVGSYVHQVAQKFAGSSFGDGKSILWGTKEKSTLAGAVWQNSLLGSALDLDDGHRLALGHPGAAIIPAAIAVAECREKNGRDLLEAIIAGYEVAIRISMSRQFERLDNVCTGAWGGFGSGIAAGKLMFPFTDRIENILGLVSMFSPRLPGYLPLGRGMLKEGIPWASMMGIQAAILTEAGFSGPESTLDYLTEYDTERLVHELGQRFLILDTYIKEYACCRWLHPMIQVCHRLMEEHGLRVEDIRQVRVETFSRAANLPNKVHPATIEEAQFSIPYCCAVVLTKGEKALYKMEPSCLEDPEVVRISEKVRVSKNEELEVAFPQEIGAKVEIETREKTYRKELIGPVKGDAGNLFSREEVGEKYRRYADSILGQVRSLKLLKMIEHLEDSPAVQISGALAFG